MDFQYTGLPVSIPVTEAGIASIRHDCRAMVLSVLDAILRRSQRDPGYPFLDTKRNLLTGEDFSDDDLLRGHDTVYGWIQGRGIEALALHAHWVEQQSDLEQAPREEFIRRIHAQLTRTVAAMEEIRQQHGGRLPFMTTRSGERLEVDDHGNVHPKSLPADRPYSFTDLFYAKGLAAAGNWLQHSPWLGEAEEIFEGVFRDIRSGAFLSDQQPLDRQNPVRPVPGRYSQGPWMIAMGGCSLLLEITGDVRYRDLGVECIERILVHHVNLTERPATGQRYDVWEFVGQKGQPFWEGKQLRSDPGHVTEMVGLALKLLRVANSQGCTPDDSDRYREILPAVLRQNFSTGFSSAGLGIVKGVDLQSRAVMHAAMPWWSLPETMRAAVEVARLNEPGERGPWLNMAGRCFNALVRHYVLRDSDLMAVQTIGPDGQPIDSIPATPDVDPAYHTGLSLLDVLGYFDDSLT